MLNSSTVLRALLLLALLPILLLTACDKGCPSCRSYIAAVKRCSTKPPSEQDLKRRLRICNGLCKKRMQLPIGDRRSAFAKQFQPQGVCTIDYGISKDCKSFRKCLRTTIKRTGRKLTY